MNIGIDIDDTISETFEILLPYSQKYTIEDLKRESNIDINKNLSNHLYVEKVNNWNDIETKNFWEKYYGTILREVKIKKFASETINRLKEKGHKIYLITARSKVFNSNTEQITKKWLIDNNVEYDKLIINASDKLKIIKENNIDLFIDDSYTNCKEVSENINTHVYMMTSMINRNFKDEKIKRVYSWPEIYYLINKEEEE